MAIQALIVVLGVVISVLLTVLVGQVSGLRGDIRRLWERHDSLNDRLTVLETEHRSSPTIQTVQAPSTAVEQEDAVSAASDRERRRQAAAAGRSSTLLTSGAGVTGPATTGAKTLLGS